MPLQNRVTPFGGIVADAARGTMMGNRGGRFHRPDRTLGRRRWASRAWITCVLEFKGRHHPVMAPNTYTELFFLDEATAIAAGHRPCFECRREAAKRFVGLWRADGRAPDLDRVLHAERLDAEGGKATVARRLGTLPDGAMVRDGGDAFLKAGTALLRWTIEGYDAAVPADGNGRYEVLTPATSLSILAAGYRAGVHRSAAQFIVAGAASVALAEPDDPTITETSA